MAFISGDNGQELSQYLSKVCEVWNKQGKFTRALVKNLLKQLESQHSKSAWLLLSEIAIHFNQIDKPVVLNAWRQASSNGGSNFMMVARILKVLGLIASKMTSTERNEVLDELKAGICGCKCSPEIISASVACISKLSKESDDDGVSLKEWCESVMSICEKIVTDSVLGTENGCSMDENLVTRSLFTLGEVAQLCPAKTSARMFVMVQSFLFSEKKDQEGNSQSSTSSSLGRDWTLNKNLAPVIRAHAFVTLGKLCLQNEDLAKSCIAAIARELEISEDPVVRNNVIVLLCDLCVRYTNLVDRYVPNIASCLKDPDPLVRRQTLTLLTQLLSEDFVKWRGSLFFKFVMAVVDENEEIRKFSEFCLVNLLLFRHPNMFSHHFVECIFFFNSYEKHKVYNQFFQTDHEKKRFSLKGDANYRKRLQLYKFLLKHMNDEQKFNLTGKLCHEVLGCVIDGDMEIDQESGQIIRDTLAILGSKDIKLSSLKSRAMETEEEGLNEQQEAAAQAVATARAKIITQVVKRNMIENIIPIIVALKHELEKRMSPLQRYLMRCLAEIVKDYRSEVQDVLATDRQLANEIEYDIRKFEERQKELAQDGRDGPLLAALGQSPLYSPSGRGVIASEEGQPFLTPRLRARSNDTSLSPRGQTGLQVGRRSVFEARKQPLLTAALINSAKKAMENSRRSSYIAATPVRNRLKTENTEEAPRGNTQQENASDAAGELARMNVCTPAPKLNDPAMVTSVRPLPILPDQVAQDHVSKSKANASETESDSAEDRGPTRNEQQTSDLELSKERVASTPQVDRTNPGQFTFLADLSVIMNSPVPAFVVPKGIRKSSRAAKKEPKDLENQIICLPSPEKSVLQRKVWNVQSPLQKPVVKELKRETTQLRKRRSSRRRKK